MSVIPQCVHGAATESRLTKPTVITCKTAAISRIPMLSADSHQRGEKLFFKKKKIYIYIYIYIKNKNKSSTGLETIAFVHRD